jgi:dipeptidyl-peptidase-4
MLRKDISKSIIQPAISIEEAARLPLPGMAIPGAIAFSPDGRWISYLFSSQGSLVRQLFKFNPQTGQSSLLVKFQDGGVREENISPEEKLRRERRRQYELGVTDYAWSPVEETILLPLPDGLYVQDGVDGNPRQIVSNKDGALLDARFSPDGRWIAYVQERELYVVNLDESTPRQLTCGARETGKSHGLAEFIAQEEMDRQEGYWWSPDSTCIAFEEADETHIPIYRIMHQGNDSTGDNAWEDHHYPFAGQANARIRLGVIHLDSSEPTWMDLGDEVDIYLARVQWEPDGKLIAQIENREQDSLKLIRFDPHNGAAQIVLVETNPVWINLNNLYKPLKDGRFIWGSERSGFQHLYLYDHDGELIHPLTEGDWMVETLAAVDEEHGLVYFTATRDSPLESHLYAVPLAGGEPQRLTYLSGMHAVKVNLKSRVFCDTYDAPDQPPVITLRSLAKGELLQTIFTPGDSRLAELKLQPPEIIQLHNRNGDLLYGMIFRPNPEFGPGPYPTIVQVYGGPYAQLVKRSWQTTTFMRAQALRSLGFLVFVLDNRGSARRGLKFEGVLRHKMGLFEVQDQVDGLHWLVEQSLADPKRVGILGWSYGGYMSLMCLFQSPDTFKAAVAGAPVTAWDGYDTHYTERYMSIPQSNPDGYQNSSVMHYTEQMQGQLLLVHGLIDENVHFRHTARLINSLIRAQKPYQLMLFPDERHGPRRPEDRIYLEECIRDFFLNNLR